MNYEQVENTENDRSLNPPSSRRTYNVILSGVLVVALTVSAFVSGIQLGRSAGVESDYYTAGLFSLFASSPEVPDEVDMEQFWAVWDLLDKKFVTSSTSTISYEEKINGAIEGLVSSYDDPYTVFLPPVEASSFNEDISGNFSGVGMEVGVRNNVITIIAPLPDTPAQRAGLLAGDVIVRIDDESTENMRVDEAVKRIRGEKGTDVSLTIFREGEIELKDFVVTRDNIDIPTVATEVDDDVFVINLYSFNALSESKMRDAMNKFLLSGKDKLILDLRGNPGGYLQSAVSIAGLLLPNGKVVVREQHGKDDEKVYRSQGRQIKEMNSEQMVVLIDSGSASASEILAGALREHGVATLIGEHTFGKGSVQELINLPEGSALKVTVARWLTPNGISISEGGLKADIEVDRTPQQFLDGEDPQYEVALRFLRGEEILVGTTTAYHFSGE